MDRRKVLIAVATACVASTSGCASQAHRAVAKLRRSEIPLKIRNQSGEPRTISLHIERDDNTVFDGQVDFDEEGGTINIEGDDYRETTFRTPGEYIVTADANGLETERTVSITWEDLADGCYNYFQIDIRSDEFFIGLFHSC